MNEVSVGKVFGYFDLDADRLRLVEVLDRYSEPWVSYWRCRDLETGEVHGVDELRLQKEYRKVRDPETGQEFYALSTSRVFRLDGDRAVTMEVVS